MNGCPDHAYPLTPYSTNNAEWIAWQFHRGDFNDGIVQAFHRASNATPRNLLDLEIRFVDWNPR